MNPKKPLSIMVRSMSDIGNYTMGFPVNNEPGAPNYFKIVQRVLPGPVN